MSHVRPQAKASGNILVTESFIFQGNFLPTPANSCSSLIFGRRVYRIVFSGDVLFVAAPPNLAAARERQRPEATGSLGPDAEGTSLFGVGLPVGLMAEVVIVGQVGDDEAPEVKRVDRSLTPVDHVSTGSHQHCVRRSEERRVGKESR